MAGFDLLEFRARYPIAPYDDVVFEGRELEAISFPFPVGSGARVMLREKDDPTTMFEADAEEVRCSSK